MIRTQVALLALLGAGVAHAADEPMPPTDVTFAFAWPDAATWRAVDQWSAEITPVGGEAKSLSGVYRSTWAFDGEALTSRQHVPVRTTPRDDADAVAIDAAFAAGWTTMAPPAPEPEPVEAPPDPATDDATPDDAEAPAPEEAAAPAEPEAPVELPPPTLDVVGAVVGDPVAWFGAVFGILDGGTIPFSQDVTSTTDDGTAVTLRVEPLLFCPDTGPGTACVEVTASWSTTTASGATAQIAQTWTVEPATLVPHTWRAMRTTTLASPDGTSLVVATRDVALLPTEPPANIVGASAR